jgi:hypothetical protein
MPLARGTAVAGYITLLGLFLAANMKVTANIPKNFQVYFLLVSANARNG